MFQEWVPSVRKREIPRVGWEQQEEEDCALPKRKGDDALRRKGRGRVVKKHRSVKHKGKIPPAKLRRKRINNPPSIAEVIQLSMICGGFEGLEKKRDLRKKTALGRSLSTTTLRKEEKNRKDLKKRREHLEEGPGSTMETEWRILGVWRKKSSITGVQEVIKAE